METHPFINKLNIKLDKELSTILDKVSTRDYITCFDCEFQSYLINNNHLIGENIIINNKLNSIKSFVLEMGGILFKKNNNTWYLVGSFLFNCPVLIEEDNQMFNFENIRILIPDYINTDDKSMSKIKRYFNNIVSNIDNNGFKMIMNNSRSDPKYRLFGSLFKNKNIFKRNVNNYDLFDDHVKIIKKYIKSTRQRTQSLVSSCEFFGLMLNKTTVVVKGNRDIDAINNMLYLSKIYYNKIIRFSYIAKVDIETFNNIFRNYTGSAVLEKNYNSIIKSKDKTSLKMKKILLKVDKMKKAHNPLVDALFTMIVLVYIYKFFKIKNLKGGSRFYKINYLK